MLPILAELLLLLELLHIDNKRKEVTYLYITNQYERVMYFVTKFPFNINDITRLNNNNIFFMFRSFGKLFTVALTMTTNDCLKSSYSFLVSSLPTYHNLEESK